MTGNNFSTNRPSGDSSEVNRSEANRSGAIVSRAPLPPLSLYIHIPWCAKKCPYCDFNSHSTASIPEQQYVDSLVSDIQQSLELAQNRHIGSIFFGGGTPSLFSAQSIAQLIGAVKQNYQLHESSCEITLEANPSSIEQQKFADFKLAGINRLSIGIQSFDDHHLQQLGRIHNSMEATKSVITAQQAGFDNINLDLMHGLSGQSVVQALEDIIQATALSPQHISWYELTIEPNTIFYNQPPLLPNEEILSEITAKGGELLAESGYQRYEISAYANNSKLAEPKSAQSKHNLNYWQYGDYIGVGAGAHSKITSIESDGALSISRFNKRKQPVDYMRDNQRVNEIEVFKEQRFSDYLLNALRLIRGFSLHSCHQRTDLNPEDIQTAIQQMAEAGFVSIDDDWVTPTHQGINFQNEAILAVS